MGRNHSNRLVLLSIAALVIAASLAAQSLLLLKSRSVDLGSYGQQPALTNVDELVLRTGTLDFHLFHVAVPGVVTNVFVDNGRLDADSIQIQELLSKGSGTIPHSGAIDDVFDRSPSIKLPSGGGPIGGTLIDISPTNDDPASYEIHLFRVATDEAGVFRMRCADHPLKIEVSSEAQDVSLDHALGYARLLTVDDSVNRWSRNTDATKITIVAEKGSTIRFEFRHALDDTPVADTSDGYEPFTLGPSTPPPGEPQGLAASLIGIRPMTDEAGGNESQFSLQASPRPGGPHIYLQHLRITDKGLAANLLGHGKLLRGSNEEPPILSRVRDSSVPLMGLTLLQLAVVSPAVYAKLRRARVSAPTPLQTKVPAVPYAEAKKGTVMPDESHPPLITRNFVSHLVRGGVKSIPLAGALVDEMIFGTLDGEERAVESEKLANTLAAIQKRQEVQSDSIGQLLSIVASEAGFKDQIREDVRALTATVDDPISAPPSAIVETSVARLLSRHNVSVQEAEQHPQAAFEKLEQVTRNVGESHEMDRARFVGWLYRLLDEDLNSILYGIDGARARVTENASIRRRVNELIAWADSSTGPGLSRVYEIAQTVGLFPR